MIDDKTTVAELRSLPLGEVIAALQPQFIKADVDRYGPFGNVFFRQMKFKAAGDIHAGHCHNYDHVTFISSGAVDVVAAEVDMSTQKKKQETAINRQFHAPAMILVKKNWAHTFTALEPNTVAHCIFAVRNYEGELSEEWDGSMEPYL